RPDPHEVFFLVQATEMTFAFEVDPAVRWCTVATRPRFEERPRCLVARSNRGVYEPDLRQVWTLQDAVEHPACQADAAGLCGHGNLPDEKRVGLTWGNIGGDEAYETLRAIWLPDGGGHRAGAEMGAMQKVAIERIGIERRALCD